MRLSLSPKEVAQIHLMLTTLPMPPIPVSIKIEIDASKIEDPETKTAFDMATAPILKDSVTHDGIVNSHSVFASMAFFMKWSKFGNDKDAQTKIIQHKDGALLLLIKSILEYNTAHPDPSSYQDSEILAIFLEISQEWINSYMPRGITCEIGLAKKHEGIGYEDNLHISMAHYCYSQGVLYNSKPDEVKCHVHEGLFNTFQDRCKQENELKQQDDESTAVAADTVEREHVEIAQLYSQFSYHKLLVLCFQRLLKDSLHGHSYKKNDCDNANENARELLKLSYENYKIQLAAATANVEIVDASQHNDRTIPNTDDPEHTLGSKSIDDTDVTALKFTQAVSFVQMLSTSEPESDLAPLPGLNNASIYACDDEVPVTMETLAQLPLNLEQATDVTGPAASTDSEKIEPAANIEVTPQTPAQDLQEPCDSLFVPEIVDLVHMKISNNVAKPTHKILQLASEDKIHKVNPHDLGGYKSVFGIFVLEVISFLQNKQDPRIIHNMCTNLRHLLELLEQEHETTRLAVRVIDIPQLLVIMRDSEHNNEDIEMLLCDIERTMLSQVAEQSVVGSSASH